MPLFIRENLIKFYVDLKTNYWFVPALFVVLACIASIASILFDMHYAELVRDWVPFKVVNAESARSLVSTIAASTMTVAGVSFSMSLIPIVHASSQIGPRVLSGFLDNRKNQIVLGVFLGTFIYALFTLGVIDNNIGNKASSNHEAIPHLSLNITLLLVLCSIFFFIQFIHHLPQIIRVTSVVNRVGTKTCKEIESFFGKDLFKSSPSGESSNRSDGHSRKAIKASRSGYLQFIDLEALIKCLETHDAYLEVHYQPGDFYASHQDLALLTPFKDSEVDLEEEILSCFNIGDEKSMIQDFRFGFDLLTEIAARALSPGVNDPYTACDCFAQVTRAAQRLYENGSDTHQIYDSTNQLRIKLPMTDSATFVQSVFHKLQYYAGDDPVAAPFLDQCSKELPPPYRPDEG